MKRSRRKIAVWLSVLGLLAAGCSGVQVTESFSEVGYGLGGSDRAVDPDSEGRSRDGEIERAMGAPESPKEDLRTGGVRPAVFQPTDYGRDIIFTADLTVAVNDVPGAGEEATRIVQSLGGFLFGQQTVGSPEPRSVLTFKVPPSKYQEALSSLGSVGEIRSQVVSANDVTEKIVDLESRITTAEASVERLRSLLLGATDIEAIVELENELLVRETELETLRGQLRTLQDQVALATIVLTITEASTVPGLDLAVTAYSAHDAGVSCPGDEGLSVEEGDEATVCYEITNTGDTWLADVDLRDPVLDVEMADLTLVLGELESPLEPGASVILAAEILLERSLRTQTSVTAQPVDEDGEPVPGRPASTVSGIYIDAYDPGGIPTFGEGLEASWEFLVRLGQVLVLIVGTLVPFLWVPVVAIVSWRYVRNRPKSGGRSEPASAGE